MRHPPDDSDTATYTATLRRSAPLDGVLPQTVGVRCKPRHTGHVRQLGLSLCGGRWRHGHPGRARASRHRPGLATTASVSNDHVMTVQRFLSGVHEARTLKKMSRLSIRQQIGFGAHRKCAALPLSRTLRDYILLTNIL